MPRQVPVGRTVLDHIDLALEFNILTNQEAVSFELNKYEWSQLVNLVASNYNNCAAIITYNKGDNWLRYKEIPVFYDMGEDMDPSYLFHFDSFREEVEAVRRRNAGQEPVEVPSVGRNTIRNANRPQRGAGRMVEPDEIQWSGTVTQAVGSAPFRTINVNTGTTTPNF